ELPVAVLPRPSLGELTDDRLLAVDGLERVEEHQVAEARHGRPHGRDRRALVNREALREVFAKPQGEGGAALGRLGLTRGGRRRQDHQRCQDDRCDRSRDDHGAPPFSSVAAERIEWMRWNPATNQPRPSGKVLRNRFQRYGSPKHSRTWRTLLQSTPSD